MRVLVAFEESQVVTKAFRKKGHEAYSCDIQECSGGHPEWHLQGDVYKYLNNNWDMIIMHPPCTAISVSGNSTYAKGKPKHEERLKSVEWTQRLWDYVISICDKVAMENPVGCLNTFGNFPKPHYIQPWQFGHRESKKTGLWLHGLPELKPTNVVEPLWYQNPDGSDYRDTGGSRYSVTHYTQGRNRRWDNQTPSGQNKLGPSPERSKLRARTYEGIAEAMVNQWG